LVYLGCPCIKQSHVARANFGNVREDESGENEHATWSQPRDEGLCERDEDGTQDVRDDDIEGTRGIVERRKLTDPVRDTVCREVAARMRLRERVDLDGIHDGPEVRGGSDGQNSRPTAE